MAEIREPSPAPQPPSPMPPPQKSFSINLEGSKNGRCSRTLLMRRSQSLSLCRPDPIFEKSAITRQLTASRTLRQTVQ